MAVDLDLFGTANAPTLRHPVLAVAVDGDPQALDGGVLAVDIDLATAPGVNRCTVTLAAPQAPPAVGAAMSVTGDAGDGRTVDVVSGAVTAVRPAVHGLAVVDVADASGVLAALRLERSYEQQTGGEIARDVCGAAGVDVADLADGARYPFVALDAGRSAWRHLARLAAHAGLSAGVDGDGAVWLRQAGSGDVAATFAHGVDVLGLDVVSRDLPPAPGVVGEGAAGSHGADAWAWVVRDPAPVRAGGDGPPRAEPALRSPEAVATAAAAAARRGDRLVLTVPIAPLLRPGRGVQITGLPARFDASSLTGVMVGVRHRWCAGTPATTRVDVTVQPATGPIPGGLV